MRETRIWQLSLQGEKVSPDITKVEPFKMQLKKLLELESLTLEQLYNCHETGLASECFQAKCLPLGQRKKASGMKNQKDCVTLMA